MKTHTKPPPMPILLVVRDESGEVVSRAKLDYADRNERNRVMQTIRWSIAKGHSIGIKERKDG